MDNFLRDCGMPESIDFAMVSLIGRIKQLIVAVLLFLVRKIVLLKSENANDLQIEIVIFTSQHINNLSYPISSQHH